MKTNTKSRSQEFGMRFLRQRDQEDRRTRPERMSRGRVSRPGISGNKGQDSLFQFKDP